MSPTPNHQARNRDSAADQNHEAQFFAGLPSRFAQVLRVALHLFAERGYFSTSIHDISNGASVSIGFIYHHFKNKEGVARALYLHLLEQMNAQINVIENNNRTSRERCREIIRMLFEVTEAEPELMRFIIYAQHKEYLPDEKSICSTTPFTRMREIIYEGVKNGEVRAIDPVVAATMAYGPTIRLICLWLDQVIDGELSQYFDDVWSNTWLSLQA